MGKKTKYCTLDNREQIKLFDNGTIKCPQRRDIWAYFDTKYFVLQFDCDCEKRYLKPCLNN